MATNFPYLRFILNVLFDVKSFPFFFKEFNTFGPSVHTTYFLISNLLHLSFETSQNEPYVEVVVGFLPSILHKKTSKNYYKGQLPDLHSEVFFCLGRCILLLHKPFLFARLIRFSNFLLFYAERREKLFESNLKLD